MKLVTFMSHGRTRIGELDGDTIHTLAWTDGMRQMLRRGVVANRTYERFPLSEVTLLAPVQPTKVIAIGLNYADHARETGRTELPRTPIVFAKLPSAVIGPGEAITWRTRITQEVDYEAELAVVIGRRAKDVDEAHALDYVFGYTCGNDVSARDLQLGPNDQWTRGKGLDTFCPLGPVIVTRDEIADPQALGVRAVLNGETMQDGSTRDMLFGVAHIVAFVSQHFTLEPGDVLLTGTPAGVGRAKQPPRYLTDGDIITVSIDGIGDLTNPCRVIQDSEAAEPAPQAPDAAHN
jgi:2-keto-4-pentenoate hydratase/2-oxohepta-3-ene-1,7-dioic acid hydratase in catechol pathway